MTDQEPRHYEIPARIRSFVYLVGMLGFPVVVASYVLVVLSGDLRSVDRRLTELGTRIDDRPMGLDKTADFIVYITGALHQELQTGMFGLMDELNFTSKGEDEAIVRDLTRIDRRVESYIRPIFRRHKRFAERFPTVGGNLGSMFVLTAAAEDISAGDSEGYLTAETRNDFGESLTALIVNNIYQFGHSKVQQIISRQGSEPSMEDILENIMENSRSNDDVTSGGHVEAIELISKDLFFELAVDAINTAVTALRDQMLIRVRLQSSDLTGDEQVQELGRSSMP